MKYVGAVCAAKVYRKASEESMTKDVLVTVRGLQMTPDGDDTIEVTTTGKYYEKDGKRYLFYDEIGDDTNLIVKIPFRLRMSMWKSERKV